MARTLVTGGAGFIGSHLTTALVGAGHQVRVLDNFSSGRRENLAHLQQRMELIDGDLAAPTDCSRACAGVEFVFHQAAVPSVPKSVEDPEASHRSNIDGTFNLLQAARACHVRRVIYASSSSIYGDTPVSPKHEDLRPEPRSPYAVQKLLGEMYARVFYECFGLETIALRYFNVFGPRQDPASAYAAAIPAFVTATLCGRPPTVFGDGEQTRDFTFIDDVVHANMLAMNAQQTRGEALNVACGLPVSVNQVITAIQRLVGRKVEPRYTEPRPGDVRHSCADIRLARQLLGYEPQVEFEEGLRRAIEYYRSLG